MEDVKKLTKEEYLEWMLYIHEMQLKESKVKEADLKLGLMLKDIEISQLKANIFKHNQLAVKEQADLAKREYEDFKKSLEEKLGMSLNGCVIDDINYEIKRLE